VQGNSILSQTLEADCARKHSLPRSWVPQTTSGGPAVGGVLQTCGTCRSPRLSGKKRSAAAGGGFTRVPFRERNVLDWQAAQVGRRWHRVYLAALPCTRDSRGDPHRKPAGVSTGYGSSISKSTSPPTASSCTREPKRHTRVVGPPGHARCFEPIGSALRRGSWSIGFGGGMLTLAPVLQDRGSSPPVERWVGGSDHPSLRRIARPAAKSPRPHRCRR